MLAVKSYGRITLAGLVLAVTACSSTGTAASLLMYSPTPEMSVRQESSAIPRLSLRLKNRGVDGTAMAVWSVAIFVVSEPGASGSVMLSGPIVPDDYIGKDYSPSGMSMGPDPAPVTAGSYSDFVWAGTGILLPPGSDGGLFDVDLTVSPDAQGKFSVIMRPFDENVFTGSSWSEITDIGKQLPFGNVGPDELLMTVIDVKATPEPAAGLLALGAVVGLLGIGRRQVIC